MAGPGAGNSSGVVGWAVDRKVPIAFFIALATQTFGLAFWIGGLTTTISANSEAIKSIRAENVAVKIAEINGRIETLVQLARINDKQMDRIERSLARVDRGGGGRDDRERAGP